ncbi:MAG: folate-binding protein YgfZ [Gammaproteobacteria bacterium]|nr:folate-binding protein YgfZ [Gammaproteobacteria bacterium]
MKASWRTFLEQNGAEFNDAGRLFSFGNANRERCITTTGTVFADLSHYGLISVHGKDAEDFLQGQFSNDIRDIDDTHTQLSSYCTPKGRMLGNFRVFRRADTYYLKIPQQRLDSVINRLRMFVLRAEVSLENASESFIGIGVSGNDAMTLLQKACGCDLPVAVDEVVQAADVTIIRVMGIVPRFEVFGPSEKIMALWDNLNVAAAPIGQDYWDSLDILAGIPVILDATAEAFVPQMANMQLINGVSFKKGCYTGQEIVARMQYLGKVKRRTYLAQIDSESAPQAGDTLFSSNSTSAQGAGKIINASPYADGGYVCLAVIEIASVKQGDIYLGSKSGAALKLMDLPYEVPEE